MTSIGLVLGAGGVAGFGYHAAALAALRETTGWDPRTADIVLGTSAGSVIGALLRGGVPTREIVERLLSIPSDPVAMAQLRAVAGDGSRFPISWPAPAAPALVANELRRAHRARPGRLALGMLPAGRLRAEVITEHQRTVHGDNWPDDALWITAVSLDTGDLIVFGRDGAPETDVASAVQASAAIPAYFEPVTINGRRYVDGGWRSATNADLLLDHRLDLIVVLSPMSARLTSALRSLGALPRMFSRTHLRREVRALREAGSTVLVIEPDVELLRVMGPNPMDPARLLEIVMHTSATVMQQLRSPHRRQALDMLRESAGRKPSPPDVPMPD